MSSALPSAGPAAAAAHGGNDDCGSSAGNGLLLRPALGLLRQAADGGAGAWGAARKGPPGEDKVCTEIAQLRSMRSAVAISCAGSLTARAVRCSLWAPQPVRTPLQAVSSAHLRRPPRAPPGTAGCPPLPRVPPWLRTSPNPAAAAPAARHAPGPQLPAGPPAAAQQAGD